MGKIIQIFLFTLLLLSDTTCQQYQIIEITNNGEQNYIMSEATQFKFIVGDNYKGSDDLIFTLRTEKVESDLYIRKNDANFDEENYFETCETEGNEFCVIKSDRFVKGDVFFVEPFCRPKGDEDNSDCEIFLEARFGDARLIAFEEVYFSKETLNIEINSKDVYYYQVEVEQGDIISLQVNSSKVRTIVALDQQLKYPSLKTNNVGVLYDPTPLYIYESDILTYCRFWRLHGWDDKNSFQCFIYFSLTANATQLEAGETKVNFNLIVKKRGNMIELRSYDNPLATKLKKPNNTYFYTYISNNTFTTDFLLYAACSFESLRYFASVIRTPSHDQINQEKLNWKFPKFANESDGVSYLLNSNTTLVIPKEQMNEMCSKEPCVILITSFKEGQTSQHWLKQTLSIFYQEPKPIANKTAQNRVIYSDSLVYYLMPASSINKTALNQSDVRISVTPFDSSASFQIAVAKGKTAQPVQNFSLTEVSQNTTTSTVLKNPPQDDYVIAIFSRDKDFVFNLTIENGVFAEILPDNGPSSGSSTGSENSESSWDPHRDANDDWVLIVFGIILPIFLCLFLLFCLYQKHSLRYAKEKALNEKIQNPSANYVDYTKKSGYKTINESEL